MLLYRSATLLITHEVFQSPTARYRIAELDYVRVVVHGRNVGTAVAGRVAAAVLALAFGVWAVAAPTEAQTIVATVMVASSLVGGACIRVTPPRHEIWASRGRDDVCLLVTRDGRVFGQVRRALMRAMENRRAEHEERGGWTEIAA
jgi:hypothetical protein